MNLNYILSEQIFAGPVISCVAEPELKLNLCYVNNLIGYKNQSYIRKMTFILRESSFRLKNNFDPTPMQAPQKNKAAENGHKNMHKIYLTYYTLSVNIIWVTVFEIKSILSFSHIYEENWKVILMYKLNYIIYCIFLLVLQV